MAASTLINPHVAPTLPALTTCTDLSPACVQKKAKGGAAFGGAERTTAPGAADTAADTAEHKGGPTKQVTRQPLSKTQLHLPNRVIMNKPIETWTLKSLLLKRY